MQDKTVQQTKTKDTYKPVDSKKRLKRTNAKQQIHLCKMPDWA